MKTIKRFLCLSIVIPVVLLGGCNHANSKVQSSLEDDIKQATLGDLEINFDKEIIGDRIETDKPLFQSYIEIVAGGNYTYNTLTHASAFMIQTYKTQQDNNYYIKTQSVDIDGSIKTLIGELLFLDGTYYYKQTKPGNKLDSKLREVIDNNFEEPGDSLRFFIDKNLKYENSYNIIINGEDFIREEWSYPLREMEKSPLYVYFKNNELVAISQLNSLGAEAFLYIIEFEDEADESKLVEPK
jgi:hypothetical protein